jgi:hypothetical protein
MAAARVFLVLAIVASLAGCSEGMGPYGPGDPGDHCGEVEKRLSYAEPDPFSASEAGRREVSEQGGQRVFAFSLGADDACKDQHVEYEVFARVVDAADLSPCDAGAPRVFVSETAVGGTANIDLKPTPSNLGGSSYGQASSIGLAAGKSDPQIWSLALNVAFDKTASLDNDVTCAKERIAAVELTATYWAVSTSTSTTPTEPSGTTPTATTTPDAFHPICGDRGVEQLSLERPDTLTAAKISDNGTHRDYTWTIGATNACRLESALYEVNISMYPPSSNAACSEVTPEVGLREIRPDSYSLVNVAGAKQSDGTTLYSRNGNIYLRDSPTDETNWSIVVSAQLWAVDHGAKDDECARDILKDVSLKGTYTKLYGE